MIAGLTTFKEFLGLSGVSGEDTPLNICLMASDSYIRNYCNRNFEEATYDQRLTPVNSYTILVPQIPLTSIAGITAFQYTTDTLGYGCSLDYVRFYRSGKIYSSEGSFWPFMNSVQIVYTSGYTQNDPEWQTLQWLQLEIAGQLYRGRGLLNMASFQSGGAQWQRLSNTETTQSGEITSMLSPEIVMMLNMFAIRGPRIDY